MTSVQGGMPVSTQWERYYTGEERSQGSGTPDPKTQRVRSHLSEGSDPNEPPRCRRGLIGGLRTPGGWFHTQPKTGESEFSVDLGGPDLVVIWTPP